MLKCRVVEKLFDHAETIQAISKYFHVFDLIYDICQLVIQCTNNSDIDKGGWGALEITSVAFTGTTILYEFINLYCIFCRAQ